MSDPVSNNAQILANQKAFMEAYERAREFFGSLPGVLSVGFGQKQRGGQFTDDVSIIVFVREKKPDEALPPEERIPPSFEGYRTDVRTPLRTVPGGCDNVTEYPRIQGGIQISIGDGALGTLGCIVRKRGDAGRENVYLLTNKHVLYRPGVDPGDTVYHPFLPSPPGSMNRRDSSPLGPIQKPAFYENVAASVPGAGGNPVTDTFFIDCAIARINIDSKCWFDSTCTKDDIEYTTAITDLQLGGVDTLADVRSVARDVSIVLPRPTTGGPYVYKVGRTTGKTRGIVRAVNSTLSMIGDPNIPGAPPIMGPNVIEIDFDPDSTANHLNCHGNPWFAEHGDSGSIVVDESRRVIGIISGVPDASTGSNASAACHILPVLDSLRVCIPTTTGTAHGSCLATDGSGIAGTTTAGGTGTGEFEFGSDGMPRRAHAAAVAQSVALTDAEREHLLGLRDAFRRTQNGRELHDVFGHVRREIGYLIRNVRPVTVTWHRTQGPGFMAHTLNHLRGDGDSVPLEINGISRTEMLERMAHVLAIHGSKPLRAAIERYHDELLPILADSLTANDCMARFAALEERAARVPNAEALT
jgi:hypothetical protein